MTTTTTDDPVTALTEMDAATAPLAKPKASASATEMADMKATTEAATPPTISDSLLHSTDDVLCLFDEDAEDRLPTFLGRSYSEHETAWRLLGRKDKATQWRKAAVAASLERNIGQRTDVARGATQIQAFCRRAGIGPAHVSRLAKTYRIFSELLATGSKRSLPALLADDLLTFKHYLLAATAATLPVEALIEARDNHWSANELGRFLTKRKDRTLINMATDQPVTAADDDDEPDVDWKNLEPTSGPLKIQRTRQVTLLLTTSEYKAFSRTLRAVSARLNTKSDALTIVAAVVRLGELFERLDAAAPSAGDLSGTGDLSGAGGHVADQVERQENGEAAWRVERAGAEANGAHAGDSGPRLCKP